MEFRTTAAYIVLINTCSRRWLCQAWRISWCFTLLGGFSSIVALFVAVLAESPRILITQGFDFFRSFVDCNDATSWTQCHTVAIISNRSTYLQRCSTWSIYRPWKVHLLLLSPSACITSRGKRPSPAPPGRSIPRCIRLVFSEIRLTTVLLAV